MAHFHRSFHIIIAVCLAVAFLATGNAALAAPSPSVAVNGVELSEETLALRTKFQGVLDRYGGLRTKE